MPNHSELQVFDRRQSPRVRCGGQAKLVGLPSEGFTIPGRVLNLSEGGCSIATVLPLQPGTRAEILLRVSDASIRVVGEVQTQRQPDVIGVEFLALSSRGRQLLVELLGELAGKHAVMNRVNAARRPSDSARISQRRAPLLIGGVPLIGAVPPARAIELPDSIETANMEIIRINSQGHAPVLDGDELDIFI